MRITKDLTPLFVKETKHEHPDADVEYTEYLRFRQPSLDSFLHAYGPLDFSFLDLSIRFFLSVENFLSSIDRNPLQEKREEIAIKKTAQKYKKERE